MEGVGARLGRSSTRYGPTTVFTGPVRRWKKKWVHMPPSSSNQHHHTAANGTVNGGNGPSHLLLYKWTPITPSQNKDGNNNDNNSSDNSNNGNADPKISNKDDLVATEEPPRKRTKYIPIILLEEQKNESSEQIEDETKPIDIDANTVEVTSKSDGYDEKPDINDVPMDENQILPCSDSHFL
ncbi:hypothetical protein BUALT_Bualt03G0083300 [Buddleja alternifolia]|uniref:Uncharacterized protein n=1 Tax=Buddleja alternifolia TaxID=168488 RepID=A0AAV6XZF3_9LAMI|nr:hypothetical protein BUALT_Bualt03G0083300 [Buddleja alternifolia]